MLKKLTVRIITTAFVVMLFSSIGAASGDEKAQIKKEPASQTNCAKTTDEDLVKTIREKLEAVAEFKDQMQHVNISVNKRVVTLEGWLDGKEAVAQAIALAKKTKCVKRVVSKLKEKGGGSCGPGQKPCGDICIDKKSLCTITVDN